MNIKHTYKLTLFIALFSFFCVFAQKNEFKKADALFNKLAYKEAAKVYEKLILDKKTAASVTVLQRLGDCYYFNTNMSLANKWYGKAIQKGKDSIKSEYYFRYAHTLEGLGKHEEAKLWMKDFSKLTKNKDKRKTQYSQKFQSIEDILELPQRFVVENVSLNTEYSDFGTSFYGDEIVFASAKPLSKHNNEKYHWNNQPYLNLYSSGLSNPNQDLFESKIFSEKLSTKYHEATAVFTRDLKKVYFTRNNYTKRLKKDSIGVTNLKLYSADKLIKNGIERWSNIVELPFNSDQYSVGHPALSSDEKELYFISDMPGTVGSTDIFVTSILGNNEFSTPKNLGSSVNTSGREMFPFVTKDKLYFASDGYLGLGGLDVYEVGTNNSSFGKATNLGAPLNSNKDDFAFIINEIDNQGYFSSNRDGGKGDDDIYYFENIAPVINVCEQAIKGYISNELTGERIENTEVILLINDTVVEKTTTNINGQYRFNKVLDCNTNYVVKAQKQGYDPKVKNVLLPNESGETLVPLGLQTLNKLIVEENGILKIKIGLIYFNLDKHFIRNDASIELNKIVLLMTQYPKMHIKIESHTDARADDQYNKQLSDRRAKSTRDYLISKGIQVSRIVSAIGYGEDQLINRCSNGVPCSEAEHQLNRRSEFIITKM